MEKDKNKMENKKLTELLEHLEYELVQGTLDREIPAVVYDSRKVVPGCLFLCIGGANFDGHDFAAQVAEQGAGVLVVQKDVELPENVDVTVVKVADTRYAMAFISAAWFGHPAEKLKVIGITGTKGKTTTTYLVKSILENAGYKVGLVGTIEVIIGDEHIHANNTTPESYLVQEYFAKMVEAGCTHMVMEVSSQAMMLHRVGGICFDLGLFTNISPDHIGPKEHESFEEYLYYKSRLLTVCRTGVVNRAMDHYEEVVRDASCTLYTYGLERGADFTGNGLHYASDHQFVGVEFDMDGALSGRVRVGMPGRFNADNALAALSVCSLALGEEGHDKKLLRALENVRVDGRMEIAHVSERCSVIVDYAHNAMSMESLLSTLRDYSPKRLVCVFGCGGNRAKERRYSMGEIGGKMADLCILTADNPRFEKNEDIIKDIETGMARTSGRYLVIPDRREAIFYAVHHAEPGDMIAIIGKGHEDYQEIDGVRHHFLDREVVEEAVKEIR